jgi:hypothetical protein
MWPTAASMVFSGFDRFQMIQSNAQRVRAKVIDMKPLRDGAVLLLIEKTMGVESSSIVTDRTVAVFGSPEPSPAWSWTARPFAPFAPIAAMRVKSTRQARDLNSRQQFHVCGINAFAILANVEQSQAGTHLPIALLIEISMSVLLQIIALKSRVSLRGSPQPIPARRSHAISHTRCNSIAGRNVVTRTSSIGIVAANIYSRLTLYVVVIAGQPCSLSDCCFSTASTFAKSASHAANHTPVFPGFPWESFATKRRKI